MATMHFFFFFIFFFHLFLSSSASKPFTEKASIIRYWNSKIPNNLPPPSFLLSKLTPLTIHAATAFRNLAATNHSLLTAQLPSFCSSAGLLCSGNLTSSLSSHPGDKKEKEDLAKFLESMAEIPFSLFRYKKEKEDSAKLPESMAGYPFWRYKDKNENEEAAKLQESISGIPFWRYVDKKEKEEAAKLPESIAGIPFWRYKDKNENEEAAKLPESMAGSLFKYVDNKEKEVEPGIPFFRYVDKKDKEDSAKLPESMAGIPFIYVDKKVKEDSAKLPESIAGSLFRQYIYKKEKEEAAKQFVEPGKFFRERSLKKGTVMPMPDIRDKLPPRSFLPRSIAGKIPFSAAPIDEIFRILPDTAMGKAVDSNIQDCRRAPSRGETKRCVTSAEDMIDFAVEVLGNDIDVRSTDNTNGYNGDILIGNVRGVDGGKVTESVSCHQILFPYLVYYCHSLPRVRVYVADILAVDSKEKINQGVAICHLDTSDWSLTHEAFVALGPGPGKIEVCHWIFEGDMMWTVADRPSMMA